MFIGYEGYLEGQIVGILARVFPSYPFYILWKRRLTGFAATLL